VSTFGIVNVSVACFLPSIIKTTPSKSHIPRLASHVEKYARL
jgi:hypothetical protein